MHKLTDQLDELFSGCVAEGAPGVQVVVVSKSKVIYQGAQGLANPIQDSFAKVTTNHQANLYSVSKFFTACCLLKLTQQGKIHPTDPAAKYLPVDLQPFVNSNGCTVEELVAHAGGAPNPLPLGWVHRPEETIDTTLRLKDVLTKNPFAKAACQSKNDYHYSNVGYWILQHVVTSVCQVPPSDFVNCCQALLLSDSGSISNREACAMVSDQFSPDEPLQYGHIPRWSMLALAARLFCPSYLFGPISTRFIRMESHCIDGVGYGGLVGSSRSVALFLQTILRSAEENDSMDRIFCPLINDQMTWGLHIRPHRGVRVFHKEGGGAGCHSSIQFRPGLAACIIAGDATFDVNGVLDSILDCVQDYQRVECQPVQQVKWVSAQDGTSLYTVLHSSDKHSQEEEKALLNQEHILCVSGGPGVPDYLQDLAALLVNANICDSVISFDQRGVGKSSLSFNTRSISIDQLLSDMDDIRKAYGLDKIHLVGHSWGSVLVRLYAQHYPKHVASVVLLSPTTVQQGSDWSTMERNVMLYNQRKGGWLKFCQIGFWSLVTMVIPVEKISNYAARKIMKQVFRNYHYDPASAPEPPADFLQGISASTTFQCRQAFVNQVKAPMTTTTMPTSKGRTTRIIPSYCIFGDDDIYGKESVQQFCRSFSPGQTHILAQCSHLLWTDQPRQLGKRLKEFYASIHNN